MRITCGRRRAAILGIVALAVQLASVSCDSATKPPAPPVYALAVLSGDGVSGEVGTALSPDPVVRVTADARPAAGMRVEWSAEDGSSVALGSSVTDGQGLASVAWTLGTRAGTHHLGARLAGGESVRLTATATAAAPARLALLQDAATLADVGDTVALAASVRDRYDNVLPARSLDWRSLDATIASVSQTGVVAGLAAGSARIVVASGALADTALVQVRHPAASLTLTPRAAELSALGAKLTLSAVVRDRRGVQMPLAAPAWTVSDSSVATVNAAGVVLARANGRVTIVGTVDSARDSAQVTVRQVAARLAIDPPSPTTAVGDSVRLSAAVLDSLGSALAGVTVAWSSADSTIASVTSAGWVRGLRLGSVEIAASASGVSATARVTVAAGLPASIQVTPAAASVNVGATIRLSAIVTDRSGNTLPTTVSWSSLDNTRATVNGNGYVTGVAPGATSVTATVGTLSAEARITVLPAPRPVAVRLSSRALTLNYVGERLPLTATVVDSLGRAIPGMVPSWSSGAACVSVGAGFVRFASVCASNPVVVVASYGALADTARVSAQQVVGLIYLTPPNLTIRVGQ
ncbi:MAG TPA: Ig-like domain-containing protein, partial [Longimicrobiales bacterium]